MAFDTEAIYTYVRRRLGGTRLNIELCDDDIAEFIVEGVEEITRYFPGEAYDKVSATGTQKRYVITQKNLIEITDVSFLNPLQSQGQLSENPFLNIPNVMSFPNDSTWTAGVPQNAMSQYNLVISSVEDRNRIYSADPTWEARWEFNDTTKQREYALYIDIPLDFPEYKVSYRYLFKYEASDSAEFGLPRLSPTLQNWLRRYVTALSRELLGDIRSKFGGIPLPDGGVGQTDGESQISRGREDRNTLLEDLRNMQRQIPIVIG